MFRQRIDQQLLWDWRTRVLLACASIPVVIETLYLRGTGEGGDATVLFTLLSVVGCLLMSLLPRVGGWAIIALWAARCVTPQTTPLSILFCLLVAVTIMTYLGIAMALAAAIAAEAATAARIWLYPWDSSVFAIVCATAAFLMVALWLGSMMSWRERQEADELERAALLRRVADQRLAEQLHHSVANDLTTILLLARQLWTEPATRDGGDGGERTPGGDGADGGRQGSVHGNGNAGTDAGADVDVNAGADIGDRADTAAIIERTAQDSLAKVRTLIAGLDRVDDRTAALSSAPASPDKPVNPAEPVDPNNPTGPGKPDGKRVGTALHRTSIGHAFTEHHPLTTLGTNELQSIAATYDERLHAHGLAGETIIGGVPSCSCTAERKAALLDILHEIVGNMMKYADPAAGYCIAVTLAPGLVTLSASNGILRPVDAGGIGTHAGPDSAPHAPQGTATDIGSGIGSPVGPVANNHDVPDSTVGIFSGGTGLERCRHTAMSLGGEFTVGCDGSAWTTLLKLPMA
ncbi:Signal transduction histidine kinase [Bifidobacterium biavatii DSM 23969]|uniref:Signal transduction histidine kinase n=2 Tax=Bifidobacterium biavatii TaxID=762212 RepID=A0A086ZT24_9BIFI|nr:Signal transduction histidine kinase [Bifidobacterium biavatii DSM 23969]